MSLVLNRAEDGVLCPTTDGSHTKCQRSREAQGWQVEGQIQAKVYSLQTDACGIRVIMLLNGGGICLPMVGVWFYSWTNQTHISGLRAFCFADRWLFGVFILMGEHGIDVVCFIGFIYSA